MILLTVEEIIDLHKKLIQATGGFDGLRDKGLLESAVNSVFASMSFKYTQLKSSFCFSISL